MSVDCQNVGDAITWAEGEGTGNVCPEYSGSYRAALKWVLSARALELLLSCPKPSILSYMDMMWCFVNMDVKYSICNKVIEIQTACLQKYDIHKY